MLVKQTYTTSKDLAKEFVFALKLKSAARQVFKVPKRAWHPYLVSIIKLKEEGEKKIS